MLRRLALIVLLTIAAPAGMSAALAEVQTPGPAHAQAKPATPSAQAPAQNAQKPPPPRQPAVPSQSDKQIGGAIDAVAKPLADIQKRIGSASHDEKQLAVLAGEAAPLVAELQKLSERLTARTAAMKARVDQLGPKPDASAAPESADTAQQRETFDAAYTSSDDLLKRARALQVQAEQIKTFIGKRQRELFAQSLFQRSDSLLSPQLWLAVAAETPAHLVEINGLFNDWIVAFNRNLTGGQLIAFWVAVCVVIALYLPFTILLRRVFKRGTAAARHRAGEAASPPADVPTTWQKILAALWTTLSVSVPMIAIMYGVVYVFSFAAISDESVMPIFTAMQLAIIRIALAAGLARGLLQPSHSRLRLIDLDDATCSKLVRIAIGVAVIVSATKIIEAVNVAIVARVQYSIAARGVGALLVAIAVAVALFDLGDHPEAGNPDLDKRPTTQRREWYGLVRGAAFAVVLVIAAAVLIGFSPLASFLVDQIVLVSGTGAVLFLLIRLIDKACELGFKPTALVGRMLITTVGLRRDTLGQVSILLAGLARLALMVVAGIIVVSPWGMQSTDIAGNVNAIFFGFKVGGLTISLEGIVVALFIFLLVLGATRGVQNWLEHRYLPETRLDSGLRNSIKTSLGYAGFLLALGLAAADLGVDFQKLAIVAGALSVGIGFGLQSIVNNFVSGLILLWERAVRVGDWIVVGTDQGYVRRINVRSTEIETFDRASVIVPNSNLVSGVVKNLMRTDNVGRLTIEISAHISADPEKVRETLIAIARDNENVLAMPSPQVRFMSLTASQMTFNLFCFVAEVDSSMRTRSDLYFEICKRFRENGFFDGPPADPMGISIVGLDKLEPLLSAGLRQHDAEAARARESA